MNTISLWKYYRLATILPFAGTVIGGIVVVMGHDDKELQNAAIGEDNFGQTIFLMVVFSFTICVLSLTIFLSKYKLVTNNLLLHILSWMALPLGCLGVMLIKQVKFLLDFLFDGWEHPAAETQMQILFVSVLIAHLVFNIFSFVKFRKVLKIQATKPVNDIRRERPSIPRPTHNKAVTPHR
jgi:hypothetical protein